MVSARTNWLQRRQYSFAFQGNLLASGFFVFVSLARGANWLRSQQYLRGLRKIISFQVRRMCSVPRKTNCLQSLIASVWFPENSSASKLTVTVGFPEKLIGSRVDIFASVSRETNWLQRTRYFFGFRENQSASKSFSASTSTCLVARKTTWPQGSSHVFVSRGGTDWLQSLSVLVWFPGKLRSWKYRLPGQLIGFKVDSI